MAERKRFLLRLDPATYNAIERWAGDDLRSVNAQIEHLLNEALRRSGRRPPSRPSQDRNADRPHD
ncbi:MAG: hypothetical protein AB7L91_01075 [Dehalococcoidia bacterium]